MKTRDVSFTASVQYNIYNIHRGDVAAGLHNNVPGQDLYLLRAFCLAYSDEHSSLYARQKSVYELVLSIYHIEIIDLDMYSGLHPTIWKRSPASSFAWPTSIF